MSSQVRRVVVGRAGGGRSSVSNDVVLKACAVAARLAGHSKLEVPTVDDGMASAGRDTVQTVVCAPFALGVAPGAIVAGLTCIVGRSRSTPWTP